MSKVSERPFGNNLTDNDFFHAVKEADKSQGKGGSSYRFKFSTFVEYLRKKAVIWTGLNKFNIAPYLNSISPNFFLKVNLENQIEGIEKIPYSDIDGAPNSLPPNGVAGGELQGSYPNPNISEGAVLGKYLTGYALYPTAPISSGFTILQSLGSLQNQINSLPTPVALGNVLFISANAPAINDLQTRATAIGRIDKPYKTFGALLPNALNGDTIVVFEGTFAETLNNVQELAKKLKIVGIGIVNVNNIGYFYDSDFTNINFVSSVVGIPYNSRFFNCSGYIPAHYLLGTNPTEIFGGQIGVTGSPIRVNGKVKGARILGFLSGNDSGNTNLILRQCDLFAGFRKNATANIYVKDCTINVVDLFTMLGAFHWNIYFYNCDIKISGSFFASALLGTIFIDFEHCRIQFASLPAIGSSTDFRPHTRMQFCFHNQDTLVCAFGDDTTNRKDNSFTLPI